MKRYRALRIITLQPSHAARVQLTPAQAFDRRHAIAPVQGEPGVYEVTAAFQFLAGEEFGYSAELPHVLASEARPVSAETAPKERYVATNAAEGAGESGATTTGPGGLSGTLFGRKPKTPKAAKP